MITFNAKLAKDLVNVYNISEDEKTSKELGNILRFIERNAKNGKNSYSYHEVFRDNLIKKLTSLGFYVENKTRESVPNQFKQHPIKYSEISW